MSNPNNLIRPPVLNTANAPAQAAAHAPAQVVENASAHTSAQAAMQPAMQPSLQLRDVIVDVVSSYLQNDGRNIVQNIINPAPINYVDQNILPEYMANLEDADKVPDVVRCLREFSGAPSEFSSWRKAVDRILTIYESRKGTPKYYAIINCIRNKITGHADAVLESYNTPLNWESITRCLTLHYADKRDLGTLEYQISLLTQGRNSIEGFYQEVYSHLSLILNKISGMDISVESMTLLTKTYRDKALDTFVRGLKGDLSRLLAVREFLDLPQALQICLKLENQSYRSNFTQQMRVSTNTTHGNQYQAQHQQPKHYRQNPFYSELAHIPPPPRPPRINNYPQQKQTFYTQQPAQRNYAQLPQPQFTHFQPQFTNFQPQFANHQPRFSYPPQPGPKPVQTPEPMEIDQTIRSRAINYINRPNPRQNNHHPLNKRHPSQQIHHQPNKLQRNFHIQTEENSDDPNHQALDEYIEQHDEHINEEEEKEISEIHFLD